MSQLARTAPPAPAPDAQAIWLRRGFAESDRAAAAGLYWQAFGGKLGRILGPAPRALAFLHEGLCPDHAVAAYSASAGLIGLAGFKSAKGALLSLDPGQMRRHYGALGTAWRMGLLNLLTNEIDNLRFLIDGIVVAEDMRSRGVGRALLGALMAEGQARGYRDIRLEVIAANPRARALYLREGFVDYKSQDIGWLRGVFGFDQVVTMVRPLTASAPERP